jgi:hypothetical protein
VAGTQETRVHRPFRRGREILERYLRRHQAERDPREALAVQLADHADATGKRTA